ncbi:MAG: hypothetical protein NVS4B9_28310 [Ktedonobacteraceae bacterium]
MLTLFYFYRDQLVELAKAYDIMWVQPYSQKQTRSPMYFLKGRINIANL